MPTPLRRLADASLALKATSSRKQKAETLAQVLTELDRDEVEAAVGFLLARPRQGAIGVGWATVSRVTAAEPGDTAGTGTLATGDTNGDGTESDHTDAGTDGRGPETRRQADVAGLDRLLDRIAVTTGSGSERARDELLGRFLAGCDHVEADFVRQVLTGESRQGALDGVMTDAVAKAAEVKGPAMRRGVMLQGDLGQAAAIAMDGGREAVAAIDLRVGRPIQPMLASTAPDTAAAVKAIVGDGDRRGTASVEWKLDGARIQVHIEDRGDGPAQVGIYTRNLNDVTGRLGQVVELARSLPCRSAVLDGELLGFFDDGTRNDGSTPNSGDGNDDDVTNGNDGDDDPASPQAFQDTMSAFGTDSTDAAAGLRPCFFDLMHLDGQSLIDEPLERRLDALSTLAPDHTVPRILTTDPSQAEAHFRAALDRGHEGVMVKDAASGYDAGRRGRSWRKVKPVHTLDLIVLAAEWGHGRRQGWLSNLHLGARDAGTGEFVMVGKTFKGLTDKLLGWQTEALQAIKVRETGHTVWVRPELVIEIALDGAQSSTRYPGGVALRFARVKGYRPDKDPAVTDTLDEVRKLLPGGG